MFYFTCDRSLMNASELFTGFCPVAGIRSCTIRTQLFARSITELLSRVCICVPLDVEFLTRYRFAVTGCAHGRIQ